MVRPSSADSVSVRWRCGRSRHPAHPTSCRNPTIKSDDVNGRSKAFRLNQSSKAIPCLPTASRSRSNVLLHELRGLGLRLHQLRAVTLYKKGKYIMAFRKDNKIKTQLSPKSPSAWLLPRRLTRSQAERCSSPKPSTTAPTSPNATDFSARRYSVRQGLTSAIAERYKRIRYKGIVCDRCGVDGDRKEGTPRAHGTYIKLVVPVAYIWYFRSLPNKIGYLLGLPSKSSTTSSTTSVTS